ncbi:MAG: hypothetical protein ABSB69_02250 [Solirubrobacteraceae bacterium]|jgi:hypothetical protein
MGQADTVVDRLVATDALRNTGSYRSFVDYAETSVRAIDRELVVESGRIQILFSDTPTAAELARSVDEIDREARRVAAAFDRNTRPEYLRGRGVRLVPTERGLRVQRADPGSLDVVLLLGGLYQAITSQPVSFALNLAALLGGGKTVLRAVDPRRRKPTSEITVILPVMPMAARPGELKTDNDAPPPPQIAVVHATGTDRVRASATFADGTIFEVEAGMQPGTTGS